MRKKHAHVQLKVENHQEYTLIQQQRSTLPNKLLTEPVAFTHLLSIDPLNPFNPPNPFLDPTIQEALEYILSRPNRVSYDNLRNILELLHCARRHEALEVSCNSSMYEWLVQKIRSLDEIMLPAKHAYYRQLNYTTAAR